jgi:hypothetical protein
LIISERDQIARGSIKMIEINLNFEEFKELDGTSMYLLEAKFEYIRVQ